MISVSVGIASLDGKHGKAASGRPFLSAALGLRDGLVALFGLVFVRADVAGPDALANIVQGRQWRLPFLGAGVGLRAGLARLFGLVSVRADVAGPDALANIVQGRQWRLRLLGRDKAEVAG